MSELKHRTQVQKLADVYYKEVLGKDQDDHDEQDSTPRAWKFLADFGNDNKDLRFDVVKKIEALIDDSGKNPIWDNQLITNPSNILFESLNHQNKFSMNFYVGNHKVKFVLSNIICQEDAVTLHYKKGDSLVEFGFEVENDRQYHIEKQLNYKDVMALLQFCIGRLYIKKHSKFKIASLTKLMN